MHFGEHLTIDGYAGDPERLNDRAVVLSCLTDLCAALQMHPLIEPVVVNAPDNGIKDPGGWSGFLMIAESHISVHTFPKRKFVSIDVYTCQNGLDVAFVEDFFTKAFQLGEVETNFLKRGTKYPEHNLV